MLVRIKTQVRVGPWMWVSLMILLPKSILSHQPAI